MAPPRSENLKSRAAHGMPDPPPVLLPPYGKAHMVRREEQRRLSRVPVRGPKDGEPGMRPEGARMNFIAFIESDFIGFILLHSTASDTQRWMALQDAAPLKVGR